MSLQAGVTGQIWPAKAQPHVPVPSPGPPPRDTIYPRAERMSLSAWALQLWSSSLLVPGARTWYFPGQGSYPSFSEMTVLVSPTLSKLFFFPCSLFPFCSRAQCEAPSATLCAQAVPLWHLVPKSMSQQSLWSTQGCREKWTSLRRSGHPRALI